MLTLRQTHGCLVLWQLLVTKTNNYISSKALSRLSSGDFTRELNKKSLLLWDALDINNFILFPSLFLILLYFFLFLLFYFEGWWRGMWQGSHMTCHMMWCHRPRTWWKNLEGDVRVHRVYMVALSKKWGKYEDEA